MFESRAGYAHALAGTPNVLDRTPSPEQRNGSITTITTRAMPIGPGVSFERRGSVPTDDDVILVTVRLSCNKDRRQSYDEALPDRPPKRSFLRRMSTRLLPPAEHDKYKAVRMPRGEYKRHFARDRDGNYAGTEAQQEWTEESIEREYGRYQTVPIGNGIIGHAYGRFSGMNMGNGCL